MSSPDAPKRKPGRPPKPPGEVADARVTLRLTAPRRNKLLRLGGAQWLGPVIDAAPEPRTDDNNARSA